MKKKYIKFNNLISIIFRRLYEELIQLIDSFAFFTDNHLSRLAVAGVRVDANAFTQMPSSGTILFVFIQEFLFYQLLIYKIARYFFYIFISTNKLYMKYFYFFF